jgi:hypothetical protein
MTDLEARKVASEWHGGQWTGLYALASSGAIIVNGDFSGKTPETMINEANEWVLRDDPNTAVTFTALTEIRQLVEDNEVHSAKYLLDIMNLTFYIVDKGPRGPVDGWANLNW